MARARKSNAATRLRTRVRVLAFTGTSWDRCQRMLTLVHWSPQCQRLLSEAIRELRHGTETRTARIRDYESRDPGCGPEALCVRRLRAGYHPDHCGGGGDRSRARNAL